MWSGHLYQTVMVWTCVVIVSLIMPSSPRASDVLHFFPIEDAKYIIRGEGWQHEATVHVTVDYDNTCLAAPGVSVMGGKLQEESGIGPVADQLQLAIHNNERSPGFEICIFFEKQENCQAGINFVAAEADEVSGGRSPLLVEVQENPNLQKDGGLHMGVR